jgi:hypothetical protein
VNPLASYTRQPDAYLPFGHTDRLSPNLEVIPFESIKGTAWVVPINFKRTDPFPKEERVAQSPLNVLSPTDAFFVVPPRSTWQHLCWEHHLIKPHMVTAQDVFDHKIKAGDFDGPAPLQPLEEDTTDIPPSPGDSNSKSESESGSSSHSSHSSHSGSSGDQARGFT